MATSEDTGKIESSEKRPQFGTRFITPQSDVFQHNAWDDVQWDEEQEREAMEKTQDQFHNRMSSQDQEQYEDLADNFWDDFYGKHHNRFFKDRHWLFTEFPELSPRLTPSTPVQQTAESSPGSLNLIKDSVKLDSGVRSCEGGKPSGCRGHEGTERTEEDGCIKNTASEDKVNCCDSGKDNDSVTSRNYTIFEVGCGVGNTVFPVLKTNAEHDLMVYCCDFSSTAIQFVKEHPDYNERRCHAFVCDISAEDMEFPFADHSIDVVVLIFVLSAIHPDKMDRVAARLARCLRPGGVVLLRDYGRYDMAQLRFKNGRCLSENFYARGDGTRVYFFTQDDVRTLFTKVGLIEEQNIVDRRLQVNRGKQLKMYRVWVQCKYRAPTLVRPTTPV